MGLIHLRHVRQDLKLFPLFIAYQQQTQSPIIPLRAV